MKKFLGVMAVVILLGIVSSGCTSIEYAYGRKTLQGQQLSETGAAVGHINVTTKGLYFLIWPIVASSTSSTMNVSWFEDTVNVPSTVGILADKATNYMKGKKTLDLNSTMNAAGFLFVVKRCQVSANVVR